MLATKSAGLPRELQVSGAKWTSGSRTHFLTPNSPVRAVSVAFKSFVTQATWTGDPNERLIASQDNPASARQEPPELMLPPRGVCGAEVRAEHVLIRRRDPERLRAAIGLVEHADQQPHLGVEHRLRVAQGVDAVLSEHLEADRAHHARPDREAFDDHVIVAGKSELLPESFEV